MNELIQTAMRQIKLKLSRLCSSSSNIDQKQLSIRSLINF